MLLSPSTLVAEMSAHRGGLCLGYNRDNGIWGRSGYDYWLDSKNPNCAKGYAFSSQNRLLGFFAEVPEKIPVLGVCCPLPFDALLDEHVYARIQCPEDTIATGVRTNKTAPDDFHSLSQEKRGQTIREVLNERVMEMRCTFINTKRYQLGAERPMRHWGWPLHTSAFNDDIVNILHVPVSLRHGLGRKDRFTWRSQGCIAYPYGSFLVSKQGDKCEHHTSRRLEYRGTAGDPPKGEPVRILAECPTLSDRFDKDASCGSQDSASIVK